MAHVHRPLTVATAVRRAAAELAGDAAIATGVALARIEPDDPLEVRDALVNEASGQALAHLLTLGDHVLTYPGWLVWTGAPALAYLDNPVVLPDSELEVFRPTARYETLSDDAMRATLLEFPDSVLVVASVVVDRSTSKGRSSR